MAENLTKTIKPRRLEFQFCSLSTSDLAAEATRLRKSSRFKEAVDLCSSSLTEPGLTATETYIAYMQRGFSYSSLEEHLLAIDDFSAAIQLLGAPKTREAETRIRLAEAFLWCGVNHFRRSEYDAAKSDVQHASDVLANISVSAKAKKEYEVYFSGVLSNPEAGLEKLHVALYQGILNYCSTEWKTSAEDFDIVLNHNAQTSLELRVVASLLRSCWCYRNNNDLFGIRSALAEAWELTSQSYAKQCAVKIDSDPKERHSEEVEATEEGHGLSDDKTGKSIDFDISNVRITDLLNAVAERADEAAKHDLESSKAFNAIAAVRHARTFGHEGSGIKQKDINLWLKKRWDTKQDALTLKRVEEALSFFREYLGLKIKYVTNEETAEGCKTKIEVPCNLVYEERGKSARLKARTLGANKDDLHYLAKFPPLKIGR